MGAMTSARYADPCPAEVETISDHRGMASIPSLSVRSAWAGTADEPGMMATGGATEAGRPSANAATLSASRRLPSADISAVKKTEYSVDSGADRTLPSRSQCALGTGG